MKVLVIGSGGREHALVWKISQSPRVTKIYWIRTRGACSLGTPRLTTGLPMANGWLWSPVANATSRLDSFPRRAAFRGRSNPGLLGPLGLGGQDSHRTASILRTSPEPRTTPAGSTSSRRTEKRRLLCSPSLLPPSPPFGLRTGRESFTRTLYSPRLVLFGPLE